MATNNSLNVSLSGQSGANSFVGRNASSNISVNSVVQAYTTTATSVSTITLTAASTPLQYLTGGTNQLVVMPVTSTLGQGQQFLFNYNSFANITFQSSGGNSIYVLPGSGSVILTCILTSGTTAASWGITSTPLLGGAQDTVTYGILATTFQLQNNGSLVMGLQNIATAGGTTALSMIGSKSNINFTGTMNETVTMVSAVNVGALGITFNIFNNSSGTITINSFSGAAITTLAAGISATLVNISTAVDTDAAWMYFKSTINT